MEQFPIFINLRGQPVLLLGEGEAAAAKARLIERAGGVIVTSLADGPRIAFVARADDAEAASDAERLRSAGLLVNVVDRPHLCDFTTPAIVDRAPVTIAIGTGGASAGLAKALRQRLELMIPTRLGRLAVALAAARDAVRLRWPDKDDRRRAIDAALGECAALDPLGAGGADGADAVAGWLAEPDGARTALQTVTILLTSGDPDDLTLGQARALASADVVVHDAGVPAAILARARADAVCVAGELGDAGDVGEGLVVVVRFETRRPG